jgi:hypothetical protein
VHFGAETRVPNVEVVNLDCGHWIQQEMPEETNQAILNWLEQQVPPNPKSEESVPLDTGETT